MKSGTIISNQLHAKPEEIVEQNTTIKNLKPEEKFDYYGQKYMLLGKITGDSMTPFKAVCISNKIDENGQKVPPNGIEAKIGEIYYFSEGCEVTWLQKLKYHDIIIKPDCCRKCGKKLVHDILSEKFGDYCPNEWCNGYV